MGFNNGEYLQTSKEELNSSELNLVVAGTETALMVESEADQLSEEIMLMQWYLDEQMAPVIDMINDFAAEAAKPRWEVLETEKNEEVIAKVQELAEEGLKNAYQIHDKQNRSARISEIKEIVSNEFSGEDQNEEIFGYAMGAVSDLEHAIVRGKILNGEPRIDGRDTRTVRPISIETSLLPRVHGSVLFTRGETQALVTATLGTSRDEQIVDALQGEYTDRFMLHYNFPPYSTGETGRVGTPKRREIGHGKLAKRALMAVLPSSDDFGYSLRVVSEITESNARVQWQASVVDLWL